MLPILEYRDQLLRRIEETNERLLLLENGTLQVFNIEPNGAKTDCTPDTIAREKQIVEELKRVADEITAKFV